MDVLSRRPLPLLHYAVFCTTLQNEDATDTRNDFSPLLGMVRGTKMAMIEDVGRLEFDVLTFSIMKNR